MAVNGGPRDGRRELVVPLVDVLVEVLLVHQPVQVEEAGLPDEGEHDQLEHVSFSNLQCAFLYMRGCVDTTSIYRQLCTV